MQKGYFYWHGEHNSIPLIGGWTPDPEEQKARFLRAFPHNKQVAKLMKPIQGKLPKEVIKAGRIYGKALKAEIKADGLRDKTIDDVSDAEDEETRFEHRGDISRPPVIISAPGYYSYSPRLKPWAEKRLKVLRAKIRAAEKADRRAYNDHLKMKRIATRAFNDFYRAVKKHLLKIEELHRKECPGCKLI